MLTISHPDKEIQQKVSDWLSEQPFFTDTDELIGEKLNSCFGSADLIKLDDYLSRYFDCTIELSGNLIFVKI